MIRTKIDTKDTLCCSQKGFSLTELVIVLAVVGVISAGIWALVAPAWERARQALFSNQLAQVVANVRALYLGQAGITGVTADFFSVTTNLAQIATIPRNMVRDPTVKPTLVDTPWGWSDGSAPGGFANGSFGVCAWNVTGVGVGGCVAGTTIYFDVEVRGLSFASCVGVVSNNTSSNSPPGLVDVMINSVSILGLGDGVSPVSAKDADTLCNEAAYPPGSTIDFIYLLRPPPS